MSPIIFVQQTENASFAGLHWLSIGADPTATSGVSPLGSSTVLPSVPNQICRYMELIKNHGLNQLLSAISLVLYKDARPIDLL